MSKRTDPIISYTTPSNSTVIDDCATLSFNDDLESVQPIALSADPGTIFIVKLNNNIPEAHTLEGEFCGRIVHHLSPKLVECLRKGHPFRAVVSIAKAHACHVLIESAKP